MKKSMLVATSLFGIGVASALVLAHRRPEPASAPLVGAAAPPIPVATAADSAPAGSASAASQDTELGRLVLPPLAAPDGVRGKAPTDEEWASAGVSLALPRAARCMGSVLEGWVRLQCESKKGAGHSVAALSGSLAKVAVQPRAHGLTQIVFPLTRGDRRMFQLEEVEIQATGEGYRGGEIREGVVVPSVVVSVVWLETEKNPRIVVTDV